MNILIFYILGILFSVIPSILINMAVKNKNNFYKWSLVILAILGYIGLAYTYYILYNQQGMTRIFTILNIASVISIVILGYFLFKEKIDIQMIVGIIFGIIAIILIQKLIVF